jgi:hypothetical protein
MSEKDHLAVAESDSVQAQIVRPLVAMPKPAASFSDHGWRAIAMCGTRWMVAARYSDAVTVEDGVVAKTWDSEAHAKLFAAAPELLEAGNRLYAAIGAYKKPKDGFLTEDLIEAGEAWIAATAKATGAA